MRADRAYRVIQNNKVKFFADGQSSSCRVNALGWFHMCLHSYKLCSVIYIKILKTTMLDMACQLPTGAIAVGYWLCASGSEFPFR